MNIPRVTIRDLVATYEVILLDAYGVLVDGAGALPGARELLDAILRAGRRFFVVTNDASRLPETAAVRFQGLGLAIEAAQVITAGSLLAPYFAEHGLIGCRCMVLGTGDSQAYARAAGGVLVPVRADQDCDAMIVCNDAGYAFLDTANHALSALYRHFDQGRHVELIVPNPDLVYPRDGDTYGFTSGAMAMLLEAGLLRRYPERGLEFARLGKPHRPIFDEARRRAGTASLVMIGDQIETDIAGARAAGMDSALVTGGVSRWDELQGALGPETAPTYVLTAP